MVYYGPEPAFYKGVLKKLLKLGPDAGYCHQTNPNTSIAIKGIKKGITYNESNSLTLVPLKTKCTEGQNENQLQNEFTLVLPLLVIKVSFSQLRKSTLLYKAANS